MRGISGPLEELILSVSRLRLFNRNVVTPEVSIFFVVVLLCFFLFKLSYLCRY